MSDGPVEPDRITDADEFAAVQHLIDQFHADAVVELRKQGPNGMWILFVPAIDSDGDEGVTMLMAGQGSANNDRSGLDAVQAFVMGTLGAVLDYAHELGLLTREEEPLTSESDDEPTPEAVPGVTYTAAEVAAALFSGEYDSLTGAQFRARFPLEGETT